jgi:hypothetical protein
MLMNSMTNTIIRYIFLINLDKPSEFLGITLTTKYNIHIFTINKAKTKRFS